MKKATVVQQPAWLKLAQLKIVVGTVRKYNTDIAADGEEIVVGQLTHSLTQTCPIPLAPSWRMTWYPAISVMLTA